MKANIIRILWLCIAISFGTSEATAQQMKWNSQYQTYIDQYRDLAIEQMLRYKIPASITLAQGIFESGAGRSRLTTQGNNHFGIKCHGWKGRTLYFDDDASNECFRAYNNAKESFEDHSKFLTNNKRYAGLFKLKITDYKGWARGLKSAGYATNPSYATRLINLIELYKLYEFDHARGYDKFMADNSGKRTAGGSDGSLHAIHIYNKNYFLQARRGDTFESIGREIGISGRKIAKYNERDYDSKLVPNELIWLKKKQKRADEAYEGRPHRVKAGESMYGIAQYYGIRLKSLYKMNHLKSSYELRVGDLLRVR
ncbi:MAG: glucosaminidase domain-containing protein [Prevotella sp.]|nr:glucosaminidase domain-containing protein [Prevotella sp.]